ncbi:MAG: type II toxin-antitoxin system HicA family toxin [bacterium]|nr:type II toxin-antitoxin system HicA family toxin [bacterium]
MSIIPVLSARVVIRKLIRAGFQYAKSHGSHQYYIHPITKRMTSIPVHGGNTIGRNLLKQIINQAGISIERFLKL